MSRERQDLQGALLRKIRSGEGRFEDLAARLFHFQLSHNAPYRAYAQSLGVTPDTQASWTGIPAVPAEVFKSPLPLTCFPPEETTRTFLTSGTTGEERGRHHFRDLLLYEAAVISGWRHADLPDLTNVYFAALPPAETPDSSLAHMFATLCPDENPNRWLASNDGSIDPDPLRSAEAPVVLLGTTLALLTLREKNGRLPLPPGSRVFHTGGFKGVRRSLDPVEVTTQLLDCFGIKGSELIHEYGMTELSSQAYAVGDGEPFRCPPWLRVQVLDPATGQEVPPGETGYLVLYDLANLDSVLAVRTRDFARAVDHSSFHLLGRDPGALPRGCSRASDAFFQTAP